MQTTPHNYMSKGGDLYLKGGQGEVSWGILPQDLWLYVVWTGSERLGRAERKEGSKGPKGKLEEKSGERWKLGIRPPFIGKEIGLAQACWDGALPSQATESLKIRTRKLLNWTALKFRSTLGWKGIGTMLLCQLKKGGKFKFGHKVVVPVSLCPNPNWN